MLETAFVTTQSEVLEVASQELFAHDPAVKHVHNIRAKSSAPCHHANTIGGASL